MNATGPIHVVTLNRAWKNPRAWIDMQAVIY